MAVALSGVRLDAGTVNNGPGGGLLYNQPAGTRWLGVVPTLSVGLAVVLIVAAMIHQVVSYRRAEGVRRQQLKCIAAALIVCVLAIAALGSGTASGGDSLVAQIWSQVPWLALAAVPISIGVAILRFRLYDIDRLISRTLGYAILTALLAGIFIGLVALTTDALALSGRVGVAASTLAAAALFNPLRAADPAPGGPPLQPRPLRRRGDGRGVHRAAARRRRARRDRRRPARDRAARAPADARVDLDQAVGRVQESARRCPERDAPGCPQRPGAAADSGA